MEMQQCANDIGIVLEKIRRGQAGNGNKTFTGNLGEDGLLAIRELKKMPLASRRALCRELLDLDVPTWTEVIAHG